MSQTTYTVPRPMRWDDVAYEAYNDPMLVAEIIDTNPDVPILGDYIQPGTVLNVPIKEVPDINKNNLPPWKR